ncbi:hypothetical protein AAF712_014251 [Marasmius tenuissimus]|uniref:Uncharacterized protein n=1 Tax=Marasmius tenuissimus TaxID=585030 RepID=A0ABR2ZCL3_9AGAR
MAVWGNDRFVVVGLSILLAGQFATIMRSVPTTAVRGRYLDGIGCVIISAEAEIFATLYTVTMVVDFVILSLTAYKTYVEYRNMYHGGLIKLIFRDGLTYFVVVFLSNLFAVTLSVLNLNPIMAIAANTPASVFATIAACRLTSPLALLRNVQADAELDGPLAPSTNLMLINEDKGNKGKWVLSKLSSSNGNTGNGENPNKRQRTGQSSGATDKDRVGEKDENLPHKNDTTSTQNPDPPQGQRLTKSLPQNKMPVPKPNLRAADYIPSHQDAYPYDKTTKATQTPPVQRPAGFSIPFTDQTYPRPYIPTKELMCNLADFERSLINKDWANLVVFVPHGGGPRWFESKEFEKAPVALLDWLRGVDFPDKGTLHIHLPVPRKEADHAFGNPFTIILEGASAPFITFLLDQCVIPLATKGATFYAHSLNPSNLSWVVTNLKAGRNCTIRNDPEHMKEVLACIIEKIWDNKAVQTAARVIQQNRPTDVELARMTPQDIVVKITNSYRLTYIEDGNQNGEAEPRYQLLGKPVPDDPNEQRLFLNAIRQGKYNAGFEELLVDKRVIQCVWCKQENHARFTCPYPEHGEGWLGMSTEEMKEYYDSCASWKTKKKAQKNITEASDHVDGFTLVAPRGGAPSRGGKHGGTSNRGGNPQNCGRGRGRGGGRSGGWTAGSGNQQVHPYYNQQYVPPPPSQGGWYYAPDPNSTGGWN